MTQVWIHYGDCPYTSFAVQIGGSARVLSDLPFTQRVTADRHVLETRRSGPVRPVNWRLRRALAKVASTLIVISSAHLNATDAVKGLA
jgi:hypothetical protein